MGLSGYYPDRGGGDRAGQGGRTRQTSISGQGTLDVLRYGAILPARTVVQVQGAGITFDGEYFVSAVTHTIKPGSYKQSFTLQRNRLVASGAGALDPASYGLGQQLPGLAPAAPAAAVAAGGSPVPPQPPAPSLPAPGPALPAFAPGSPAVPSVGTGATAAALPASPST